ncbi:MAG: M20/M25/M40 family metallo-hydrolase [Phycisphaerales bacterium]|nr:MAG: M20/M25/M40 family metallo-hydrolase [Phycisphaerales bacterium]
MTAALEPVLKRIDEDFDNSVARLCELLRIKSIGTDPAYDEETRRAAQWCADQFKEMGFDSAVRNTPGQPMVVAHYTPPDATDRTPRVMYYGHYDVQPPDPLELWDSDPFEPTIVEAEHGKRIVARGANDDKGQFMTFVSAFRAWTDVHGSLPVKIIVFLEGEEESASPSLEPFLEANQEELAADICIVSDSEAWSIETPAITYMLRGMVFIDVTLKGPAMDLHSGMYGGGVVNPNNALARILGELHDENGLIQIPGMYDDVRELSEAEAKAWENLGFDDAGFLGGIGLKESTGEKGRTLLQRLWSRPTCDVNGMWGGYIGQGAKTVIPAEAHAKISCRLVPDQDPEKIYNGLVKFLKDRTPPDCTWEIECHGKNPAIRVPTESPYLEAALKGLRATFDNPPVLIGCGGSIPVVGSFQRILGFDSLLAGFGLEDDRIHSPNEKFELKCYHNGIRSQAAMMHSLAELAQ